MEIRETYIGYCVGDNKCSIFSSEKKWVNKVLKLKEKYPNDITIEFLNADGSVLAYAPIKWMKFSPPRKMSEEQKKAAGERMRNMHQNRNVE